MNSLQSEQATRPDHILVVRFSSLGDILLTAPAVRSLRRRFPFAEIDFLVKAEFAETLELIPGIDRTIPLTSEQLARPIGLATTIIRGDYSLIVDFQNSPRSSFLRAFSFPPLWVKAKRYRFRRALLVHFKRDIYAEPRPVPLRYIDALNPLGCTDDERGLELARPAELSPDKTDIVLCPGAKHFTKRWPAENWAHLAATLTALGHSVAVVGAPSEAELLNAIADMSAATPYSNLSIKQVAALIANARIVVSNDSGLMHMAAGYNIPLVALFGPTVEQFGFYPFRARAIVLEHKFDCRPCSPFGTNACPKQHFRCMLDTTPESVTKAIDQLLAN